MKYKLIIITLLVVLLAVIVHLVFNDSKKDNVTIAEKPSSLQIKGEDPQEIVIEIDEVRTVAIEEEFPSSMDEYDVQDAIHGMSHQKVQAEDKWGFLPMTQDRVQRLIEVVEENKSSYENSETYLRILHRWASNDFSQVDEDHNAVWELQGGNVGRATGILNAEEEKAFIKKHFNTQIKK